MKKLLEIELPIETKAEVLEKTLKYLENPRGNFAVMSLNPEIFVLMQHDSEFKKAISWGKQKIIDGVGVVVAAQMLHVPCGDRFTGVDFMDEVLKLAAERSFRVVLIGGKENVAEELANCYSEKYPNLSVRGIQGIRDISRPKKNEEEKIFSIVADVKPHYVFFAFGSPAQEKWLYSNRAHFEGIVCAGVGGAFNFLSGRSPRAPQIVRRFGMEWSYRLITEPWRWRRQLRLLTFIRLVVMQRLTRNEE